MLSAEQYRQAEFGYTVAEAKRGFKIHVAVYALVMTALSALNALLWVYADVNFPWAALGLVGWGIGLTFHYIYGFRRADEAGLKRRHLVENFAEREKELV